MEKDRIDNDIDVLKNAIRQVLGTLEKIALYQKKVVMLAKVLQIVSIHFDLTKDGETVFVKIDREKLEHFENASDFEKYVEIVNDERTYRKWLKKTT